MYKQKTDAEKIKFIKHNIYVARSLGYDYYTGDGAYEYDFELEDYMPRSTMLARVSLKASTLLTSKIWAYGIDSVSGITSDKHNYLEQLDFLMPKIVRTMNDYGFCAIEIDSEHVLRLLSPPEYFVIDYNKYTYIERHDVKQGMCANVTTNGTQSILREKTMSDVLVVSELGIRYFAVSGGINKASTALSQVQWHTTIDYLLKQNFKIHASPASEVSANYMDDSTEYNLTPGGINKVNPREGSFGARISPLMPPELTEHFMAHDQHTKALISEIYDLDLLVSEQWMPAVAPIATKIYQMIRKIFPKDNLTFHSAFSDNESLAKIMGSEKLMQIISQLSQIDQSILLMLDAHKFVSSASKSLNAFPNMLVSENEFRRRVAQAQAQAQKQQDLSPTQNKR